MRWCVILGLLAACEDETKAPAAKPVEAEPVAKVVVPPDALPPAPADAGPRVALSEHRETLDVVISADLKDSLAKFTGLDEPADPSDGSSVGIGPSPVVKLEGASGDLDGLTRDDVDRVVKSRAGILRACYRRAWLKDSSLEGKLVINLVIDPDGKVSSASAVAAKSTLHDAAVEGCVTRQILKLKFPAKGGAHVNYPFVFTSG